MTTMSICNVATPLNIYPCEWCGKSVLPVEGVVVVVFVDDDENSPRFVFVPTCADDIGAAFPGGIELVELAQSRLHAEGADFLPALSAGPSLPCSSTTNGAAGLPALSSSMK